MADDNKKKYDWQQENKLLLVARSMAFYRFKYYGYHTMRQQKV